MMMDEQDQRRHVRNACDDSSKYQAGQEQVNSSAIITLCNRHPGIIVVS